MAKLTNARLEEIALYGAQYNTLEAREMAKELLNIRTTAFKAIGVVTSTKDSAISNDMRLDVSCEKGADVKVYDLLFVKRA
ncbi:MAG: hypothetical protein ACRCZO_16170 [Cetobacterium sp.]